MTSLHLHDLIVRKTVRLPRGLWKTALCASLAVCATVCGIAQPSVGPLIDLRMSQSVVRQVEMNDLDGDGVGDAVYLYSSVARIQWMKGFENGDCTFPQTIHSESGTGYGLRTADLDEDGDLDLVASTTASDHVVVYWNNGVGDFGEPQGIAAHGAQSRAFVMHDFDLDGDSDLLVSWEADQNRLVYYPNLGLGVFDAGTVIGSTNVLAHDLVAADFTGDGYADVVCADKENNRIMWFENNASGGFNNQTILTSNAGDPNAVAAIDIDSDGDLDIVRNSVDLGRISWHRNNNGSFTSEIVLTNSADDPYDLLPADIDGDGLEDLVFTTGVDGDGDGKLNWYRNDPDGEFDGNIAVETLLDHPTCLTTYDFDNDGYPDPVTTHSGSGVVRFPNSDGSLDDDNRRSWYPNFRADKTFMMDMDGDGDQDLVTTEYPRIGWVENIPMNGHNFWRPHHIDSHTTSAVGDLNADGLVDFVLKQSNWLRVYIADNSGHHLQSSFDPNFTFSVVKLLDYNHDGALDVIINESETCSIYGILGNGDGTFGSPQLLIEHSADCQRIVQADINQDGRIDLFIGPGQVFYGTEAGGFEQGPLITQLSDSPGSVLVEDIDGDGDMDVVCSYWYAFGLGKVYLFTNQGNEVFSEPILLDSRWGSHQVKANDMDLDGDLDLVVGARPYSNFSSIPQILENLGGALFGPSRSFANNGNLHISFHDIDGDGYQDIFTGGDYGFRYVRNTSFEGCMDSSACNYNPSATTDNGNCCYSGCGCTNSSADNYDPAATCSDNSCIYPLGCTNEFGLNYDPDAVVDDGSCEYTFGCTNEDATNFDPVALYDDGSCMGIISGVVWDDLDGDGYKDFNESGVAFQNVLIQPGALVLTTDNFGQYQVELPFGSYTLEVGNNPNLPFNSTPNPVVTELDDGNETVNFGVLKEEIIHNICVDFYPPGNTFLCNAWINHNICFRNLGNVPIDGVVTVYIDPLFQGWEEVTPIDSVNGNTVYMSFTNLPPGEMYMYDILLLSPTVDFIGEYAESSVNIEGVDDNGDVVATGAENLFTEIACAYDPNDKQAFPLGFGDDHRLLENTEQEFLVRFQNTGNAPAQDVVIRDTLDANFDINTFQIVANSHNMMAQLNLETREVQFQFFDIQLPDSTCCEPESHGLVSYSIRPLPGLEPGTRLENTAYIYFDNNDPIVTNTTWTTIHACGQDLAFQPTLVEDCPVHLPAVSSNYMAYSGLEGDFYWTADGDLFSDQPELVIPHVYDGNIQLTVDNPLCTEMANVDWTHLTTDFVWHTCPGDVDCSGTIGTADLNGMLGQFACANGSCAYEMTGDGEVSAADLLVVLGQFGLSCPE